MRVLTQPERPLWPIVTVFVASVLVTLLFWTILPASFRVNEDSDYLGFYEPVARNILEGRGFTSADGGPAIRYPPGYPLLLAGILGLSDLINIPEGVVVSGFILLGMGLTSLFLFFLAQSLWRPLPALAASLVWMTYPAALWLTKQPSVEIPFMVVFYGSFCFFWYALLRKSRTWPIYLFSGLLIGFAMLIRPIAIGVGLVMAAILWLARREMTTRFRLFLVTMLLLGNLVAIFPWETWLYSNTGRVVMLSTGGASSMRDGLTFAVRPKSWRQGVKVPQDVEALMQDILARVGEIKSLGGVISVMIEEWRTRPLAVAKLYAIKAARSWYGTDSQRFEIPIILIQSMYVIPALWGSQAAWKRGKTSRQLAISIWLVVLYFWGMTVLALSIVRYMVPAMGLLFVLLPGAFSNRESMEAN
jgi:hypothetical protein